MRHTTAVRKLRRAMMARNGTGALAWRAAGGRSMNNSSIALISGSTVMQR